MLADEMGLGKTVQALAAVPEHEALVVVCPASLKWNWAREIGIWRPDLEVRVLSGKGATIEPVAGVASVINYDILPESGVLPGYLAGAITLIADEAHYLKSAGAKRTKRFRKLARAVLQHDGRVWLMTGTPLVSRPPDLWNVLRAARLDEVTFGSWPRFVWAMRGWKGRFGYQWGRPRDCVPEILRRAMLRRERRDVLPELPAKTWDVIPVDMKRVDLRALDDVLEELRALGIDLEAAVRDADDSVLRKKDVMERCAQIRKALASAKLAALVRILDDYEDAGEPVVVFSAHRAPILALGERKGWGAITGTTPGEERERLVRAFQDGQLLGLAGTIGAMGTGVTLTRAHQVIFVDLSWTPAENAQAEDRICRIGQTRGVIVRRMVARHVLDEHVTKVLARKQDIISGSVEAAANGG